MEDPLSKILRDLSMVRGEAYTQMVRTPAPDPLKKVLQEVDGIFSRAESEIRGAFERMPKPPFI